MNLLDVTLKNLRRRAGRMLLLVFGLSIGVATAVALTSLTEAMETDVTTTLDEYGANILIVPKASDLSVSYGGITVASAAYNVGELTLAGLDVIETIRNAANVSVVSPKLLGTAELMDRMILLAGVRFDDELLMKSWWLIDGERPGAEQDALAGRRLAQELGLEQGETVEIDGTSFKVVGILAENGSQDDDILFIGLGAAQVLFDKPGAVTLAEVAALCTGCPIEEMVAQIGAVLPQARVTALRQAVQLRMQTAEQLASFGLIVSAVVALIGTLVVLTTMLSSVAERRQEIGLFRALGFRRRHIARIVLGEATLVSLIGGAFGWGLGVLGARLLLPQLATSGVSLTLNPWLAVLALAGSVVVGLAGAAYPAAKAARLDPTTALRSL